MPRPFPLPINIGTDICSITRILRILKTEKGTRFVERVLSEREREENPHRLQAIAKWSQAYRLKQQSSSSPIEGDGEGQTNGETASRKPMFTNDVTKKEGVRHPDPLNRAIMDASNELKVARAELDNTAQFLAGRYVGFPSSSSTY